MENEVEKMTELERDVLIKVVTNIRQAICEKLFEYDLSPVGEMDDEKYDMEVIRLYRSMLKFAVAQDLFDHIDKVVQTKLKAFNKK